MTPRPGQSLGGRPVTETVTPVNMGNRPHCDNGEGVASASPLPSRLKEWIFGGQFSRPLHGLRIRLGPHPSSELLGYCQSFATADWLNSLLCEETTNRCLANGSWKVINRSRADEH